MKIKIKVKPNSGKQEIRNTGDGEYKVFLKSSPENNKANIELLKIMKKYFGKETKIISGFTSRNKLVEVLE